MFDLHHLAHASFERWRDDLALLSLAGIDGFTHLAFDHPGSNGLGGMPPRYAVWAEGPHGIVAIDARPRTPPSHTPVSFFDMLADKRRSSPLIDDMRRMACASDYTQLDVVPLIKAYTGLVREGRTATLLYLFQEPAREMPENLCHRADVAAFAQSANLPRVRFIGMSFADLWADWESRPGPAWLAAHTATLREADVTTT